MALVVKDRVKVSSTTTGTGTFTLGSAALGFQDFSVIGDGNTTYYTITGVGSAEFEVGIGTFTASGTTLSRDTILESSNAGSAVNFSAGAKEVFVTYPAERAVYTDAAGTAITPATASVLGVSSGGTGITSLGTGVATFLGTPSSANLAAAVTDETGSGSLVFATSPTFVTPLLGTPTSGNLANCTFPTLNQSTTGNAATATALQTARTINGTSFDGTANITITANTTNTLTLGTGLGGSSFNGSAAVTATVSYGTSAGTACQGNDARLSDSRQATNTNTQLASLGVGTGASGTSGEIRATNNVTAFYSDKRLKDIIGPINNALYKVSKISGIYYTQNKLAESFGYNNYEQQVGVIAQEIQEVLPEAVKFAPFDREIKDGNEVSKSGEEYLTVQYEKLVPLLVEAIKELRLEVELLKAK
jgi:hypothetical protein